MSTNCSDGSRQTATRLERELGQGKALDEGDVEAVPEKIVGNVRKIPEAGIVPLVALEALLLAPGMRHLSN